MQVAVTVSFSTGESIEYVGCISSSKQEHTESGLESSEGESADAAESDPDGDFDLNLSD